ncbi:MAG: transcriptional regulator [Myxococcales bacterium]|nr:transcriptional regulator [Myxococcales bacterium]
MKLIKRYTNRKLYDTERSCYVTLDEIAEMVRAGEEVSIVDNKTGEDLTTVTLAQIVFENEKRDRKTLPLQSLRMIIQSPSDFLARLSRPVQEFRDEAQQRVERLRRRAEEQQEEIVAPVREFLDGVQRSIDELGTRLDERLKDSVDSLTHVPSLSGELADLRSRVERLEAEVSVLRDALEERRSPPTPRSTRPSARQ